MSRGTGTSTFLGLHGNWDVSSPVASPSFSSGTLTIPHGVESQLLSIIPSSLGFPTTVKAALSLEGFQALAALYDSSCLQNWHNLGDTYTLPSLTATIVPFGPPPMIAAPEVILPRIFHLSDAGLILTTDNFSTQTNQYIHPNKEKVLLQ